MSPAGRTATGQDWQLARLLADYRALIRTRQLSGMLQRAVAARFEALSENQKQAYITATEQIDREETDGRTGTGKDGQAAAP